MFSRKITTTHSSGLPMWALARTVYERRLVSYWREAGRQEAFSDMEVTMKRMQEEIKYLKEIAEPAKKPRTPRVGLTKISVKDTDAVLEKKEKARKKAKGWDE